MIGARMFRIVTITPTAAKALNFDQKPNKTINYNGKTEASDYNRYCFHLVCKGHECNIVPFVTLCFDIKKPISAESLSI
jgi:hypothetical protein